MMEFFIQSASSFAGKIDNLILTITIIVFFWFFLAQGVFFWLIFKFRQKNNPRSQYITGEKKEEKKWITIPHFAVLVCDVVILGLAINVWYHIKQDLPPADETIRVIGHQWSWRFIHPGKDSKLGTEDDVETVDELHLKVNKTYHFKLESADVLHNFSVPVFRLKQDAVPGRVITGWFKPTKTGTFDIQCAEMCGIGHGIMGAKLVVEDDEAHNSWLSSNGG